jgi:hypothetical protein
MARRRRVVHKSAKTTPEDMDGGGSSKVSFMLTPEC